MRNINMIIKALAKRPDSKWMYALIPRTVDSIKEFIGGEFVISPITPGLYIIYNAEQGLPYCCRVLGAELGGNILLFGNDFNGGITDIDITISEAIKTGLIMEE